MLLLDLTHTSHTRARTGIQRVARSLYTALRASEDTRGVCFDPYQKAWRTLEPWEERNFTAEAAAASRGARWPWSARLRGALRRRLASTAPRLPDSIGLIMPEIFSPATAAGLPPLFKHVRGPRLAVFHDAIALKLPELTPAKTVARFPAYLRELLAFDGIAAISEDSRQSLLDYWRWLGVQDAPPVQTIPLGLDLPLPSDLPPSAFNAQLPVILCVGSIEGRKNHPALLNACEQLWARGLRFELHLIGLAHPQTGRTALEKIAAFQRAGRPLRYDGAVDDATVITAYRACTFTVYPSLMEGFGLPVLESLAHGKPCVCSSRGALGEAALGGGCMALESVETGPLAAAIAGLLQDSAGLARLAAAAHVRTFKPWRDYAAGLAAWLQTLPRRP
ncbi:MAG TPA: glycosyltransferase [Opitutaceae bacterium]|jgi:glycosyltransferase involved in cell wall biosynthesis|nr:glycosyltransferase [Opitutaceae bacterium]